MSNAPTTELVAIAWLKGIAGVPTGQVGTRLPGDESRWADGFLTVLGVGGSPDIYVPMRKPVVSVDAWVPPAGSQPQWGKANVLLDLVRDACYSAGRDVTISVGDYGPARVLSVFPLTEPRRIQSQSDAYAHYSIDLQFNWTLR